MKTRCGYLLRYKIVGLWVCKANSWGFLALDIPTNVEMDEEDPNDIVVCPCVHCKFQTPCKQHQIIEEHARSYGIEDIGQYRAWFDAHV